MVFEHLKSFLANLGHGDAIGKQSNLFQNGAFTGLHGRGQGRALLVLHGDNANLRAQILDVGGDARRQSAAADRNKDRVNFARTILVQYFSSDGALTGDAVGVVVGVHEGVALFVLQVGGKEQGLIK